MSDFSPFELTPTNNIISDISNTVNLKRGNHISMIILVFLLLICLYTYVLYLYIQEKKNINKIKKNNEINNCIGIKDDKSWD